jgi:hypothetical protein
MNVNSKVDSTNGTVSGEYVKKITENGETKYKREQRIKKVPEKF